MAHPHPDPVRVPNPNRTHQVPIEYLFLNGDGAEDDDGGSAAGATPSARRLSTYTGTSSYQLYVAKADDMDDDSWANVQRSLANGSPQELTEVLGTTVANISDPETEYLNLTVSTEVEIDCPVG